MSDPTEREALEQLISCPGWHVFINHVKAEWGAIEVVQKIKRAITDAKERKEDVSEAVLRVNAAHDAVNALMLWPRTRAQTLTGNEAARQRELDPPLSRRGTL